MTAPVRVDADDLRDFVAAVYRSFEVSDGDAGRAAEALVIADLRGIDSHGVNRLPFYVHKLREGLVDPRGRPRVVTESPGGCVVDGGNGLGAVASLFAMDRCIEGARASAGSCATVAHSNHFGIAGYYALRAVPHGMIGVAMTNATALVAPTFGREVRLGTNPIAVAIPAKEERPIVLDMATSAVAFGKLELALGAGQPIPEGWALDAEGRATTDPVAAFGGALLPLGSTREHGSHKGYGLALVVDVLCALLSGAAWGPHCLGLVAELSAVANVGHFFAALRVDAFRPLDEFTAVVDEMIRELHATAPAPGFERVLVAGEPEFDEEEHRRRDGIPLTSNTVDGLRLIAADRGLDDRLGALLG